MQIIPGLAIISKTRRLIVVKEINTIRNINYVLKSAITRHLC